MYYDNTIYKGISYILSYSIMLFINLFKNIAQNFKGLNINITPYRKNKNIITEAVKMHM